MTIPAVLTALAQAAVKRRFFTRATAARLVQAAQSAGVGDAAGLRAWLGRAEMISPDLGKKLAALLPPGDGLIYGIYTARAHLADGGMGSVWLADRAGADGLVVVKTMKTGMTGAAGAEALKRFEREARITRQVAHPNVVRCVDSGVQGSDTLYLVLEYVDSGDLRDLVDATGGLGEPLALAILLQVADGLAAAHQIKLVHRDIKPGNIFVASTGQTKLADFGIARTTDQNRTMLTMEGAVVGSPQYMSPEQITSPGEVDIRSDLYALGAVLYFCLAEEPPYAGRLQEILHQHMQSAVPDVRTLRPDVSAATQAIIAKCMAKTREQRFQDPAQLRTALAEGLKRLGVSTGDGSGIRTDATPAMIRAATAQLEDGSAAATLGTRLVGTELPTVASNSPPPGSGMPAGNDLPTMAAVRPTGEMATIAADLSGFDSRGVPLNSDELLTMAARVPVPTGEAGELIPSDPARPAVQGLDLLTDSVAKRSTSSELPTMATDLLAADQAAAVETAADEPEIPFLDQNVVMTLPSGRGASSKTDEMPTIETAADQIAKLARTPYTAMPAFPTIRIESPVTRPAPQANATSSGITFDGIGLGEGSSELMTMTAMLMAEAKHQAHDPGTGATVIAGIDGAGLKPVQTLLIDGDLSAGMREPWIALAPAGGTSGTLVLLYAKARISFGKLRDPSIDLCLRNYPIAEHKDACSRISRTHGHLVHDPAAGRCLVEDANAANGTKLDGIVVAPGSSVTIPDDGESVLEVAGVVVLRLKHLPRRGHAVLTPGGCTAGAVGLDASAAADAITITRPENRPELAQAMVLRRITIGGPGSDLPLAGARSKEAVEFALAGGHWIWRPVPAADAPAGSWKPLINGAIIPCGGLQLKTQPANHDLYA